MQVENDELVEEELPEESAVSEELPIEEEIVPEEEAEEVAPQIQIPQAALFKVVTPTNIQYTANIIGTPSVYNIKNGTVVLDGNKTVSAKQQVYVRQEVNVNEIVYSFLVSTSSQDIGWVEKKSLDIETVLSTKQVNYEAFIGKKNFSLDSLPWGTEGYTNKAKSEHYINQKITAVEEKTTRRSTFVLVKLNGTQLGWIDKNALVSNSVLSERTIQYAARFKTDAIRIFSKPTALADAKQVAVSKQFNGKNLIITKEMETSLGTFSFVKINSTEIGWVPKSDLNIEVALSTTNVSYGAKILTRTNTIDSLPYGLEGFENVAHSKQHYEKTVVASKETVTRRGTFVLISLYGRELGWIDSKALQKETVISERDIQYAAKIVGRNNTVDSKPYGLDGFVSYGRTTDIKFANKNVVVKKEMVTSRGTFALVYQNSTELGWVDRKALDIETVISTVNTTYAGKIVTKNNSIDTLPYGVEGFSKISSSGNITTRVWS